MPDESQSAGLRDQSGKVRVQVIDGRSFVGYVGDVIPAAEDGAEEDCLVLEECDCKPSRVFIGESSIADIQPL